MENTSEPEETVMMNVRVAAAQKNAYKSAARQKRKSLSVWIRETLDAAAESQGFRIESDQ